MRAVRKRMKRDSAVRRRDESTRIAGRSGSGSGSGAEDARDRTNGRATLHRRAPAKGENDFRRYDTKRTTAQRRADGMGEETAKAFENDACSSNRKTRAAPPRGNTDRCASLCGAEVECSEEKPRRCG